MARSSDDVKGKSPDPKSRDSWPVTKEEQDEAGAKALLNGGRGWTKHERMKPTLDR